MTAGAILEEIDAIFASRPKPTGSKQAKPTKAEEAKPNKRVLSDPASDRKQKKKKSKSKLNSTHEITTTDLQAVEEVFDPSAAIVQASVPLPVSDFLDESGSGGCKGTRTKVVLDEEELAFRDSRGTRQFFNPFPPLSFRFFARISTPEESSSSHVLA